MNGREYIQVFHEFSPVFDEKSKVLILGTFPSVKSREGQFYYHHPQNRFWKVIAALVKEPVPQTVLEKKEMLLRGHIAIWDVVQSCRIKGSSDSSIRDVVPSHLHQILDHADIRKIFANGTTAFRLYRRYCEEKTKREAVCLPSTSPANASWRLEALTERWSEEISPFL